MNELEKKRQKNQKKLEEDITKKKEALNRKMEGVKFNHEMILKQNEELILKTEEKTLVEDGEVQDIELKWDYLPQKQFYTATHPPSTKHLLDDDLQLKYETKKLKDFNLKENLMREKKKKEF
eukprot:CAMPEP_0170548986 /NCGR_PEP_ID=MMETSP0211-20121228/7161_1 /TAXON_ID=311385 /ORGANISM="Pseudokeronopsis sp., Strain OXSARD2" /LENGTH=121 /DNA_ID=CAMNT_0010854733 /DNA_START=1055 /DNA_END=1420 /DNA_ORIENTATION=+